MGSYSYQPLGEAGGHTDMTQHHNMHSAQYLEQQATAFLNTAGRSRARSAPSAKTTLAASHDDEALSLWQQAAGIYSTDGDEGELSWQADALCAQTDPEAFFPEKGGSTRDAKRVCNECPVREACLEYAMENDERFGIWGGLSERERRRLRKQAS
ncbi:MAG: WhiB family transcriptional regulator [Rothia sp. (in: high G+C Gram-positive bacteria)]|nr:WhiB family transcriptional regulator [Rothia sp. (in: high G+C Gram-positive bacteria)]